MTTLRVDINRGNRSFDFDQLQSFKKDPLSISNTFVAIFVDDQPVLMENTDDRQNHSVHADMNNDGTDDSVSYLVIPTNWRLNIDGLDNNSDISLIYLGVSDIIGHCPRSAAVWKVIHIVECESVSLSVGEELPSHDIIFMDWGCSKIDSSP
jgi:hypothetical protein